MTHCLRTSQPLNAPGPRRLCVAFAAVAGGCAPHVILIPPGGAIQLGQATRTHNAFVFDEHGQRVQTGSVDIPAGWYAVPPPPAPGG